MCTSRLDALALGVKAGFLLNPLTKGEQAEQPIQAVSTHSSTRQRRNLS